jgi:hypothetical protein
MAPFPATPPGIDNLTHAAMFAVRYTYLAELEQKACQLILPT